MKLEDPSSTTGADAEEDDETPKKEAKIVDLEPSGCVGDDNCPESVTASCGTCNVPLCDRHKFTAFWNKTIVACMRGHLPLPLISRGNSDILLLLLLLLLLLRSHKGHKSHNA